MISAADSAEPAFMFSGSPACGAISPAAPDSRLAIPCVAEVATCHEPRQGELIRVPPAIVKDRQRHPDAVGAVGERARRGGGHRERLVDDDGEPEVDRSRGQLDVGLVRARDHAFDHQVGPVSNFAQSTRNLSAQLGGDFGGAVSQRGVAVDDAGYKLSQGHRLSLRLARDVAEAIHQRHRRLAEMPRRRFDRLV